MNCCRKSIATTQSDPNISEVSFATNTSSRVRIIYINSSTVILQYGTVIVECFQSDYQTKLIRTATGLTWWMDPDGVWVV